MYNIIGYSSNRNLAIQSKLGIGKYFAMDAIIHFQSIFMDRWLWFLTPLSTIYRGGQFHWGTNSIYKASYRKLN